VPVGVADALAALVGAPSLSTNHQGALEGGHLSGEPGGQQPWGGDREMGELDATMWRATPEARRADS
jgi:hypothetical protein